MLTFTKMAGNMYLTTLEGALIEGVHGDHGRATHFNSLTLSQAAEFRDTKQFWVSRESDVLQNIQHGREVVPAN
jgi:hypothetical protein